MYSYTYDKETGGILLNSTPTGFSKEPRPVYAPELDVLGFDKYWKYDKQTDYPYMWAEANRYWYRGHLVASLNGGNVYNAPIIQLAFECKEFKETQNGKPDKKVIYDVPDKRPTLIDKKGNVFTVVEPEPNGGQLVPINIEAMVERTDKREFTRRSTREILEKHFPKHNMTIIDKPLSESTKTQTKLYGDKAMKPGEVDIIMTKGVLNKK